MPRVCWTRAAGRTPAAETAGHYCPYHLVWCISILFLRWRGGWNTLTLSHMHKNTNSDWRLAALTITPTHTLWRGLALPTWVKVSFQRGPTSVYLRAGSALQPCVRLLTNRILYNGKHTRRGFVSGDWTNALYKGQLWLSSSLILLERQWLALKSIFHIGRAVNRLRSWVTIYPFILRLKLISPHVFW